MRYLENKVREINDKNGWVFPKNSWNNELFIASKLCLLHSEISETLEALRKNNFENFKEELADIFIRLVDLSTGLNIDLGQEILKKLDILSNRSFKHGNKRL